jgi:hypothetical protein
MADVIPNENSSELKATPIQEAVTQADRDFAARWIVIAPENIKLTREGKFDNHSGVQAARLHRLSNTAHSSVFHNLNDYIDGYDDALEVAAGSDDGKEVERVAKAIEIAFAEKTLHHPVSKFLMRLGWLWPVLARAAIAAMRTARP